MIWTAYDIARLRQMYAHGASHAVIAKALGRTTAAVSARLSMLGLKLSPEELSARRAAAMALLNKTAEQRQRASVGLTRRRNALLSWCPEELRPEYRRMMRSNRMTAAEARRIMEDSYKLGRTVAA